MRAIEKNLYIHENGTYYALWTVKGITEKQSLKTRKIGEARRALKILLAASAVSREISSIPASPVFSDALLQQALAKFFAGIIPGFSQPQLAVQPNATALQLHPWLATQASQPLTSEHHTESPAIENPNPEFPGRRAFKVAVEEHHANTPFKAKDTERNFKLQKKKLLDECEDWPALAPIQIWKKIKDLGYKSAPNQMRWYLRSFANYCHEKKWISESILKEAMKIPLLWVNHRQIQMPEPEVTEEWLKMCEAEDALLGSFIRFLATTGLRKTGGNQIKWEEIDLLHRQFRRVMKGGKSETFPMIPEAFDLLQKRSTEMGEPQPELVWNFSDRQLKKATRLMKKYAKGLKLGLTFFHALRHHFASVALSRGFSPAEVALMLGHKDGGKLICEVYGHVIQSALKNKADNLRIVGSLKVAA